MLSCWLYVPRYVCCVRCRVLLLACLLSVVVVLLSVFCLVLVVLVLLLSSCFWFIITHYLIHPMHAYIYMFCSSWWWHRLTSFMMDFDRGETKRTKQAHQGTWRPRRAKNYTSSIINAAERKATSIIKLLIK